MEEQLFEARRKTVEKLLQLKAVNHA